MVAGRAGVLESKPPIHASFVELVVALWVVGPVDRLSVLKNFLAETAHCLCLAGPFQILASTFGRITGGGQVGGGEAFRVVAPLRPGAAAELAFHLLCLLVFAFCCEACKRLANNL